MRVLLDTHTFLWWVEGSSRLSSRARELIRDSENEVYLSAVTAWEIAIKAKVSKLEAVADPERYVPEQMALDNFLELPITVRHALHVYALPLYHRDPVDRLLVVQSQLEDLPIVTCDQRIARYDVEVIW